MAQNLKILPNPTTGELNVGGLNGATTLEVFNLLGQKVYSRYEPVNSEETIDISSQPTGVYFVVVKGTDGIITGKVLKQ